MNCQKFNILKDDFINQRIDYGSLDDFLEHYENCKSCKEELEVSFLIAKVFREDNADCFHLAQSMQKHIVHLKEKKRIYYKKLYCKFFLFIMAEGATLACVFYYIWLLYAM